MSGQAVREGQHGPDCPCVRCRGFAPGNAAAVKHGVHSERQIVRRATVEKRRALRQIGVRERDLEAVGRAMLQNWARAAAALRLMDAYAEENGWLDEQGEPRGFARLYVSMLNAERLALTKLGEHLRDRQIGPEPLAAIEAEGRRLRLAAEAGDR